MHFFVKFWGTRGSIPTPGDGTRKYGGNTTCVEIRSDEGLFICDGGTGIRELGLDLLSRHEQIHGNMLFSHAHWDHIQGFPFFVPVYQEGHSFTVFGTHDGDRRFYDLLSGQMESSYFPVDFTDLKAHIAADDLGPGGKEVDGVEVKVFEQHHPGRSFAYSFERGGKKIVFSTDNELDLMLPEPEQIEKDPDALRKMPEEFLAFIEGADLLVADGQYTDAEYPEKVGWGHARASTVVDLAVQARVKQLAITHHDPMQTDRHVEAKIADCRERARRFDEKLVVFGAREGLELKLD
jgi:phosphoribosyl 1,2-cyclic phosphodiesterase